MRLGVRDFGDHLDSRNGAIFVGRIRLLRPCILCYLGLVSDDAEVGLERSVVFSILCVRLVLAFGAVVLSSYRWILLLSLVGVGIPVQSGTSHGTHGCSRLLSKRPCTARLSPPPALVCLSPLCRHATCSLRHAVW